MLTMTYQYALKPTPQQIETMTEGLNICRRVWNYALAERKDWYNSRSCRIDATSIESEYIIPADAPRPNFALQCKALTEAKKTKPWLKTVQLCGQAGMLFAEDLNLKAMSSEMLCQHTLDAGFGQFLNILE